MDPQHHESAGMQLPPPVEQAPGGLPAEQQPGRAPEHGNAAAAEQAPGASAPAQMPTTIPLPTPPQMPQPQAHAQQGQNTPTAGLRASDDSDLIEKEWVNKAKQIVEKTRDDPYKQSEELTLVKVDYMKKRYNKTLKLK